MMVPLTQQRRNYMLRELWQFPLNPIYFFLKHFCIYTSIFTFSSTIAFWHAWPFVYVASPYLFYSENDLDGISMIGKFYSMFVSKSEYWVGTVFLQTIWFGILSGIFNEKYPWQPQKMRDVRIGLAGMLISVWMIIASIFTRDSLDYWKISHTSYHLALFLWPIFMMLFISSFEKYFLQIDFDKYPYHKMIKFISVIGIIHVSFAAYFIQWSIAYLLILILTVTSFIFCVDLYTVMTAKAYMFREHYHYDWVREKILYHEEVVQTPDGRTQTIQWSML